MPRIVSLIAMLTFLLMGIGLFAKTQRAPVTLFCPKTLEDINVEIRNDTYGKISSLIIYEGQRIIYEKYYGFSQPSTIHPISSVTKSITSIAVGICIDKGYIPSVDVEIKDYFPEFEDVFAKDSLKQRITLRHLLSQTTGFKWDEWTIHYSYADNPLIDLSHSKNNWNSHLVNLPMASPPGVEFCYNSACSELIKEIISRSSGVEFKQFVVENILEKLNISTFHWDTYDGNGVPAWGGLSLTTRDMAKIGNLVLCEGLWGNTRIVSAEWIRLSVKPLISTEQVKYGLHWWVGEQPDGKPLIYAAGYGDQYVYVAPDKKLVIAFNGQNFTDHKWDKTHNDLITSILNSYNQ